MFKNIRFSEITKKISSKVSSSEATNAISIGFMLVLAVAGYLQWLHAFGGWSTAGTLITIGAAAGFANCKKEFFLPYMAGSGLAYLSGWVMGMMHVRADYFPDWVLGSSIAVLVSYWLAKSFGEKVVTYIGIGTSIVGLFLVAAPIYGFFNPKVEHVIMALLFVAVAYLAKQVKGNKTSAQAQTPVTAPAPGNGGGSGGQKKPSNGQKPGLGKTQKLPVVNPAAGSAPGTTTPRGGRNRNRTRGGQPVTKP